MKLLNPEFKHSDDRRTITQLFTGWVEQVNTYEAKKGSTLGNHYHKHTIEYFYILKGTATVYLEDTVTHSAWSQVIRSGDLFVVHPYEFHTIDCLTDVEMMTFLSMPYDKDKPDIYKE